MCTHKHLYVRVSMCVYVGILFHSFLSFYFMALRLTILTKVGVAAITLVCGQGVGPVKGHGHRGHIRISVGRREGHPTGNGRGDALAGFRTQRPDPPRATSGPNGRSKPPEWRRCHAMVMGNRDDSRHTSIRRASIHRCRSKQTTSAANQDRTYPRAYNCLLTQRGGVYFF